MEEFNILEYLKQVRQELKATREYQFCRVSDPEMMEEVITGSKRASRFFAVDDSQEGILFEGDGDGWFERKPVVVFLLGKLTRWPDMDGREKIYKNKGGKQYQHHFLLNSAYKKNKNER